jgi:hypothetical protein
MSVDDRFQEWFDLTLHGLIIDRKQSIEERLAAYDSVEQEATRALLTATQSERLLSVRRELASLRLVAAKQRDAPPEIARRLFDACEALGYASIDAQLNTAAIFARMCLRSGAVESETGELDRALRSAGPGIHPRLEQLAEQLAAAKRRE